MDTKFIEVLDRICKKEYHELTEHDKLFLKARRTYMSQAQKKKFFYLFKNTKETVEEKN